MAGHARIENVVFDDYAKRIGCIGLAIYGLLLRFANDDGECWPSLKTIEDTLDISRPTCLKYLGLLVEEKLVVIQKRRDEHGNQDTTLYHVITPESEDKSRVKQIDPGAAQSKNDSTSRVKNFRGQSKNSLRSRVNDVYPNNTQLEQDPLNNDLPPPPQRAGLPGDDFEQAQCLFGQNLPLLEDALGVITGAARKELIDVFESYIRRGKCPTLEHLRFAVTDARGYAQTSGIVALNHLLTGLSKAIDPRTPKPNGPQRYPQNGPRRGAGTYVPNGRRTVNLDDPELRAASARQLAESEANVDRWLAEGPPKRGVS